MIVDGERVFTADEVSAIVRQRLRSVKADSAPRAVLDAALGRIRELEERVRQLEEQIGGKL